MTGGGDVRFLMIEMNCGHRPLQHSENPSFLIADVAN